MLESFCASFMYSDAFASRHSLRCTAAYLWSFCQAAHFAVRSMYVRRTALISLRLVLFALMGLGLWALLVMSLTLFNDCSKVLEEYLIM